MLWMLFSLLTALFESVKDVFSKRSLKQMDEYVVAWAVVLFALPFVLPFLFYTGIPELSTRFWLALVSGGLLNILALILVMKALKRSDISVVSPMVAFTPLFLLLTSPIMVGEFPTALGLAGVLLIVLGSYFLKLKEHNHGILAPFRALLSDTGARLMLIAAFIWAITSNIDKIGVQESSPLFWVIAFKCFVAIAILPIVLIKSKGKLMQAASKWKMLLPVGFFAAATLVCQMAAIQMTLVAYVISIKRTSAIMAVLWGCLLFREKGLKERLLGAAIMVLGVVLITLS